MNLGNKLISLIFKFKIFFFFNLFIYIFNLFKKKFEFFNHFCEENLCNNILDYGLYKNSF